MTLSKHTWLGALGCLAALASTPAHAQGPALRSTDFQEVFLTAGYATLFGAATGAAMLPFLSGSPSDNLRFVAGGASVGFLAGSAVAFYNLTQRETAYDHPSADDDAYGFHYEQSPHPLARDKRDPELSQAPSACQAAPALVRGCDAHFSLSIPAVAFAPQSVAFSVVSWTF